MVIRQRRKKRHVRRGLASLEAVIATAITFPIAALLLAWGIQVCRQIFAVIGPSVGWPYL